MSCSNPQVVESSSHLASFLSERELLGESSSPFIVEGDGLTSQKERESVCIHVLPSLVAHAVEYEMIIGAHNTVYV